MACHHVSIEIPYTPQRDNGLVHKTEEAILLILIDESFLLNTLQKTIEPTQVRLYNADKNSMCTAYEMVTNNLLYLEL